MLDLIKQLFSGEERHQEPPTGHQIAVAATALMVQLARVDSNQDDRELETIVECAVRAHEVTEEEARDILQDALDHADDATSLYEFTGKLNEHLEQSDKQRLLESIWAVALADGRIDRYEEHLIRRIADLLHLNHREYMQARHRAEDAQ
ncbi:TerB family tellurite resistance protein [Marinobacter sp.]|uniref:tellurite resistance TerB family protein n=1 Tax=Marinobacter sp. TaxID=50741 RepID=UPI0019BE89A4|nr:TerB family tellurite resistance protein [Marinobacter sp.]MBC7191927.1 TerB family tellurite resistance protein [Marinobacter sp.]